LRHRRACVIDAGLRPSATICCLFFLALAFAAVAYWRRNRPLYRRLVVQPVSVAISLIGLFWTLQRAFG